MKVEGLDKAGTIRSGWITYSKNGRTFWEFVEAQFTKKSFVILCQSKKF